MFKDGMLALAIAFYNHSLLNHDLDQASITMSSYSVRSSTTQYLNACALTDRWIAFSLVNLLIAIAAPVSREPPKKI